MTNDKTATILIIMATMFLATSFVIFADNADAANERFTEGIFDYEIIGDTNEVKIYASKNFPWGPQTTTIDIPSSVTHNGETYTVTTIGWGGFVNPSYAIWVTKINIPTTVTVLEANCFYRLFNATYSQLESIEIIHEGALAGKGGDVCHFGKNLRLIANGQPSLRTNSFEIDPKNPYYKTVDGTIFSKDGTTLIRVPSEKEFDNYRVPDGVKTISNHSAASVKINGNLTISSDVEYIGDYAFNDGKFNSLTFECNRLRYIGASAFYSTDIIGEVILPDSVEYIGTSAFCSCSHITSVTIGNKTEIIGNSAFSDCEKLASIKLGNSVKVISGSAFEQTMISEITIPASVEVIGLETFYDCKNLKTIKFLGDKPVLCQGSLNTSDYETPTTVTIVTNGWGDEFSLNRFIVGITTPEGIEYDTPSEPFDSGDYKFVCYERYETAKLIGLSEEGMKKIPIMNPMFPTYVTYKGEEYVVSEIESNAFSTDGTDYIQGNITLPEKLVTIGGYAFHDCNITGAVKLPDTLKYLGVWAFWGSHIDGIDFGKCKLEAIEHGAFCGTKLVNVVIPDTVKWISGMAFSDCSNLESFDTGNGALSLGEQSINYCPNLKTLILGDSITFLPVRIFFSCDSLSCDLRFGPNLKFAEEYALCDCPLMDGKTITIEGSPLLAMGSMVFINDEPFTVNITADHYWYSPVSLSQTFGIKANIKFTKTNDIGALAIPLWIVALTITAITMVGIIQYRKK